MRVFRKSVSLLMILVFALTLFPLGDKAALASTASDFRTIVPGQQWFFFPNSVAADGSGNFYVADTSGHRILKYDPSGILLENWGPYGTGAGKFYSPAGVAVDSAGNVYVADTNNHRIQKRNAGTGVWTTWGSNGSGNKQFISPSGVAVDADGNVYVADTFNSRIQKFDSNGNYLTQWGGLGSEEGQFKYPFDLAVSSNGTVYVADQNNSRIQMFSAEGTYQGMWGEKGSGEGQFNIPASVDVDSNGNVYVLDSSNSRVQKFQADGTFLQQWGSGGLSDGQFSSPRGIAVSSSGSVFVADTQNRRIQKFTSTGSFQAKWGSYGNNDGELYGPIGLAVDGDGNLYVGDSNARISKFNSAGAFDMKWGSSGLGDEQFYSIRYMAADNDGNIYISDLGMNSIKKYASTGTYLGTPIRGGTNNVAQLWNPMGIAFDHNGNMYVCSSSKYLVLKFDSNYNLIRSWGSQGSGNGQFDNMGGIAVDSSGNVYVADTNNSRIQKFSSEGGYLTQWGGAGSTNGKFYSPRGIAVDSQDNVYVGDGNRVQKFTSSGVFQVAWGSTGNGEGQFSGIYSLAVDSNDKIYVADTQNHRIQRLTNLYTVTFNSNGGDTDALIMNAAANTTVTLPEAPEREGFTFAGWYSDDGDFENEFTGSTPVTGDLTVYAKWTALQPNTYTVTFDSNEGSPVAAISNVTANGTVTLPAAPSKEGYTFAGWYSDDGDFENEFTGSTPVTGDLTVYAKWTALQPSTYTVTFDSNEGSPVAAISNVTANGTVTLPAAPSKEGYTFAGWYSDDETFENEFTGSTPVTGDLTVYAKWTALQPNTYTVTFDSNEGSPVAEISNVTANGTVTLPAAPSKEGYTFAGWYTDNGVFAQAFTALTPVTGNLTVYAKWTRNSSGGNNGGGGGSNSSKPPTTPSSTVTGDVKNGTTGSTVANITAAVTKDSKNRLTLTMPADQLVVVKQPNGTATPLIDGSKVSITGEDGTALTVSAKGTLQVSGLAQGTDHTYTISYDFGKGQKINLGTLVIEIDKKGNVTKLNVNLIDPYGILTDGATGEVIAGAQVTLYYADTARNKAAGKTPGTLVELPVLKDFEPNNNKNPQISDKNGAYGFMVYPSTDYYLAAGKEGYEEYKSPTISVEQDLVKWDMQMMKPGSGVNRLAGLNQVDTALAIAQATFPGKLNQVVLATADNYPDALAGSVLAYQLNAPILLVGRQEADQEKVLEYLKNSLDPRGEVYILGGTAVVSRDMEAKIQAGGFSRITRLAGIDRYETALKIAEHLGVKSGTPVILAYGESYPDALSVSSIAARMRSPIFLVPKNGLSSDLKEAIARIMPSKVYIIGGTAVVSPAVEAQTVQLTSLDETKIVRIGGQDAYETSLAVANYFNESGSSLCIATGNNFPDALTGSVYASKHNAPILLVDSSLSNSFIEYMKTRKLRGMTLFGGTAVVNTGIEEQLRSLLEK